MTQTSISWIDKGVDDESIAHKQHSNIKVSTPIRDVALYSDHICLAMSDGNIQIRKRTTGKLVRTIKFTTRRLSSPKRVFCNTIVAHNNLVCNNIFPFERPYLSVNIYI